MERGILAPVSYRAKPTALRIRVISVLLRKNIGPKHTHRNPYRFYDRTDRRDPYP
jgi:hypothetical protein